MTGQDQSTQTGKPGSPSQGEPVYLAVGLLRRPHGVRGDLLLEVYTHFPERLKPGTTVFVGDDHVPAKISRRRPHNDGLILGFAGVNSSDDAAKYRSKVVFVPAEDRPPLPEGEYYHHQIIGLKVFNEDGRELGAVSEILETGANDVYIVVRPDGRELLLPALKQVLLEVNIDAGMMRVHLLPGLVDEDKEEAE